MGQISRRNVESDWRCSRLDNDLGTLVFSVYRSVSDIYQYSEFAKVVVQYIAYVQTFLFHNA